MKRKIVGFIMGCLFSVLAAPAVVSYADIVDAYWDGKEACWDDTDDDETERYQIVLYRGDTKINTVKTTRTYYNFSSDLTRAGTYRFRVRAYVDGEYNAWSAYSEDLLVKNSSNSTSTTQNTTAAKKNQTAEEILGNINYVPNREGWQIKNGGWHYQYSDGSEIKNRFAFIDGAWYNFDQNGSMRTGWFQRGQVWFYLDQNGAMALGWQQIGDKWYYFNPSNGFMLTDTTTPDGYKVGADGAMIR